MKYVLISADNSPSVYFVPDVVADNLRSYCIEFCDKWLHDSPYAEKYRTNGGVCYDETDFIEYLNTWIFPNEKSVLIEKLDWVQSKRKIPKKYRKYEWFNF